MCHPDPRTCTRSGQSRVEKDHFEEYEETAYVRFYVALSTVFLTIATDSATTTHLRPFRVRIDVLAVWYSASSST